VVEVEAAVAVPTKSAWLIARKRSKQCGHSVELLLLVRTKILRMETARRLVVMVATKEVEMTVAKATQTPTIRMIPEMEATAVTKATLTATVKAEAMATTRTRIKIRRIQQTIQALETTVTGKSIRAYD